MQSAPATAGKKATTGMLATARIPAATGTSALSKGHQQEKAQSQQQKCQPQQDLCGKAMKVAGNEARNIWLCMWQWHKNLVAVKVPKWPWFLLRVACRDLATLDLGSTRYQGGGMV
jgi:hypothetical protein